MSEDLTGPKVGPLWERRIRADVQGHGRYKLRKDRRDGSYTVVDGWTSAVVIGPAATLDELWRAYLDWLTVREQFRQDGLS